MHLDSRARIFVQFVLSINVKGVNFINFYIKVSLDALKLNNFEERDF